MRKLFFLCFKLNLRLCPQFTVLHSNTSLSKNHGLLIFKICIRTMMYSSIQNYGNLLYFCFLLSRIILGQINESKINMDEMTAIKYLFIYLLNIILNTEIVFPMKNN